MKTLKEIKDAIEKRYNPTGEKFFQIAILGSFSGPILSENVVLMSDSKGKRLYITDPSLLNPDQDPLISIVVGNSKIGKSISEDAKNYPEILQIWNEEIMGN